MSLPAVLKGDNVTRNPVESPRSPLCVLQQTAVAQVAVASELPATAQQLCQVEQLGGSKAAGPTYSHQNLALSEIETVSDSHP